MWIFTTSGFFSVVAYDPKKGKSTFDEPHVLVRARALSDLDALVGKHGLTARIDEDRRGDYHHRMVIPQTQWAEILTREATDIDYNNFKSAVGDDEHHNLYMKVWAVMRELQH